MTDTSDKPDVSSAVPLSAASISSDNPRWNAIERVSKVLSIAAIPITVAIVGWILQDRLSDKGLRRDYVQLAVSILKDPDSSKTKPEIRNWAVDLLNDNSPTKFSPEVIQQLKSGNLTLSAELVSALAAKAGGKVAVSPDGRFVLIAADSGEASLWSLSNQRILARWKASSRIESVAFSPNGKLAATGGADGTVGIREIGTGIEVQTIHGHEDAVTGVVFSPDGRVLLTSSLDRTIKQWDTETWKLISVMELPA